MRCEARFLRPGLLLLLVALLALLLPLSAAARPPQRSASPRPLRHLSVPPRSAAGARLVVWRVASAPAGARAGHEYALDAAVRNDGTARAQGRIVVHLVHVGSRPLAIGSRAVAVGAHAAHAYNVRVRVPRLLPDGSYALVACVSRGHSGALCMRDRRAPPADRAGRDRGARRGLHGFRCGRCSSGAHSLSPFGSHYIRRPATAVTRASTRTRPSITTRTTTCCCRVRMWCCSTAPLSA